MRQSPLAAARGYARALIAVASAQGDPARLAAELRQVSQAIERQPKLRAALTHPGLGADKRSSLVAALFAEGSPELRGLLALLAERGDLALVPQLAQAFARAWNERRRVVSAEVVSAVPLDDAQRTALAGALAGTSGRGVEIDLRVDPSLLGGLMVTMGGTTFDGSVRAQLQSLRRRLVGEAAA